jgi:probable addiction module antidote protein
MRTKLADLPAFDMVEHLTDESDVAEYLNQVLAERDASEIAHALGVAAKARGAAARRQSAL